MDRAMLAIGIFTVACGVALILVSLPKPTIKNDENLLEIVQELPDGDYTIKISKSNKMLIFESTPGDIFGETRPGKAIK
jgi:hypothetical protein